MWPSIVSKEYKYRILSLLFHTMGRLPYGEGHQAESQEPTTNKDPWNTSTNKKWEHAFVSIQVRCLQQAWSQSVSTSYRKMTRPKRSILPAPLPPSPPRLPIRLWPIIGAPPPKPTPPLIKFTLCADWFLSPDPSFYDLIVWCLPVWKTTKKWKRTLEKSTVRMRRLSEKTLLLVFYFDFFFIIF